MQFQDLSYISYPSPDSKLLARDIALKTCIQRNEPTIFYDYSIAAYSFTDVDWISETKMLGVRPP